VDVLRKESVNVSTVYIVQEMPNHDLAAAMKFGEMEVLLPSNTQIAFSTVPTVRTLRRKLREYKDGDFLLLTGDPVAIGLACSIAAFYNSGRFTALKWDRREKVYLPVKIDITENGERDD
jgi:hypothetical protein